MNRAITRTALAASGAILSLIGGSLVLVPKAFLETSDVIVENDPGLLSELVAPSGVLIITGVLMIAGALRLHFANLGLVAGAIVYGSYGAGRLVSIGLHGMPSQSLIIATLVELGIAAVLISLRLTGASATQREPAGNGFQEVAA